MFNENLNEECFFLFFFFFLFFIKFIYNVVNFENMKWRTTQSLHLTSSISLNDNVSFEYFFFLLLKLIRSGGNLTLKLSFALTLANLLFPCCFRGSRGGCYGDSTIIKERERVQDLQSNRLYSQKQSAKIE